MTELRQAVERLGKLETDISWIKNEIEGQGKICGKTADDVTEIKIMLAEEKGRRKAMAYIAHAITVVLGAVAGFVGGRT